MGAKKTLVPKLRFPEFRDAGEWEVKTLGKVCDMQAGKFIRASDIKDESADGLYPCYGGNGLRGYTETYTHAGEYSLIGRQGALCGNVTLAKDRFHATEHAVVVTPNEKVSTVWLYYVLNYLNLNRFATGQAQPGLSIDNLKNVEFRFASKKGEQQKIADCLSSLDALIAAQADKINALKTHKKGLMQKLFPRDGETVPRLRFPEFRDAEEWEEKPLGKLLSIGNGRDHKHLPDGEVPVYGSGGYMRSVNDHLYDGESVCIGRKGTIDKPVFLAGKFWTVDTLFYTHSFKRCLPRFIYSLFQNIEWKKHNEAGGVPSLSKTNIEKIEVALPGIEEQQKIANCLSFLDVLITAHTEKLDFLKTHKKGLMQQLFPSLEAVSE